MCDPFTGHFLWSFVGLVSTFSSFRGVFSSSRGVFITPREMIIFFRKKVNNFLEKSIFFDFFVLVFLNFLLNEIEKSIIKGDINWFRDKIYRLRAFITGRGVFTPRGVRNLFISLKFNSKSPIRFSRALSLLCLVSVVVVVGGN